MSLDEIVQRFLPIDDGTGKYVFDTWTNKIAHREQMITLLPAGVRGDDIKRHPVFIERGAYYLDQVGFDPTGADRSVKLNTWQGWPMQPKEGCCDRLLELIEYLCSGDPDQKANRAAYEWLLNWMAYPLQHPGAKMSSAVIMHGPQGTGKSTVFQTLARIYGDYSIVLNQRGLEDKFNSDWADSKLFILAEEVVTRAEMWHIKNELKELVTGEWIRINPKNVAAYRQRNQINIAYLSNEHQPLPLENDDRRHLVVYTPPALGEDFYDEVQLELERGGTAAFYSFLLQRDLSAFHPKKRPPMTEAKGKLIAMSSPSELRFAHEWVAGDLALPVCPALTGDLYAAYLRWCRDNGEQRPRPSNQFFGAIERQPGWDKKKARYYPSETSTSKESLSKPIVYPPLAAIKGVTPEQEADLIRREGTSEPVWLGRCVRAFSAALSDSGQTGKRLSA
jgi:putative DNA primase/helicase